MVENLSGFGFLKYVTPNAANIVPVINCIACRVFKTLVHNPRKPTKKPVAVNGLIKEKYCSYQGRTKVWYMCIVVKGL